MQKILETLFGSILLALCLCPGVYGVPQTLVVSPQGPYTGLSAALADARDGDTIEVRGGEYAGPLKIEKSVTLLGQGWPIIDGNNRGGVVEFAAPGIRMQGFIIRNSGISLDHEDAGISVNAPRAVIENNRILHVLFGIYMRKADSSVVRNNTISGKEELAVPRRGDLLRAWYSNAILIESNTLQHGRDMIIWFSKNSIVQHNRVANARYGIHFMYSDDCLAEYNLLTGNSVGVYFMYSRRLTLRHNTIAYNRGPSGFGIGLKDFDDGLIEENLIVDNRVGIYVDNSPREITSSMTYNGNAIAYNDVGVSLLSFGRRSDLLNNSFVENYEQVSIHGNIESGGNRWHNNYWSDYAGYDRERDGFGDLPYKSEKLFENLMERDPGLRLFIYSPAIQALDFAARAFPMVRPQPKLEDPQPLMAPRIPAGLPGMRLPTRWPLALAAAGLLIFGVLLTLGLSRKSGVFEGVSLAKKRNREREVRRTGEAEKGRNGEITGSPLHPLSDSVEPQAHSAGTPPAGLTQGANMMIQAQNLTKSFGKLIAVDKVSFQINPGEAVAFWGSNGAGKTTLLRCLLGVIPFEGEVRINGFDVVKNSKAARRVIGFVPQEISFHDNLSVRETLAFYARLKKTTPGSIAERAKRLNLEPHLEKTVKELSGGMKQRLALAIALLAEPPLLFLDEPTANLDMKSRDDFLELLSQLKKAGKTIVFSSHRMEEVFSFADRVLVLDQGRLIADAPPKEVYQQLGKRTLLRIYLSPALLSPAREILETHGFNVSQNGAGLKVQVDSHSKGQPISLLAGAGVAVENFDYEIEK